MQRNLKFLSVACGDVAGLKALLENVLSCMQRLSQRIQIALLDKRYPSIRDTDGTITKAGSRILSYGGRTRQPRIRYPLSADSGIISIAQGGLHLRGTPHTCKLIPVFAKYFYDGYCLTIL